MQVLDLWKKYDPGSAWCVYRITTTTTYSHGGSRIAIEEDRCVRRFDSFDSIRFIRSDCAPSIRLMLELVSFFFCCTTLWAMKSLPSSLTLSCILIKSRLTALKVLSSWGPSLDLALSSFPLYTVTTLDRVSLISSRSSKLLYFASSPRSFCFPWVVDF
jgi:hypothetical protein